MCGYGAIRYSIEHPELFAGALVLSPAVYTPLPPADARANLARLATARTRLWKPITPA